MAEQKQIECVLLPQFECNLLLPRASVVQVVDGEQLDIVVDLQGAMLGKLQWQGWTVPLMSFEAAVHGKVPKYNSQTKSVIVHSLMDDEVRPFIALTSQGIPKVIEINDRNIKIVNGGDSDFIQSKVIINTDTEAFIPELPVLVSYTAQYL